MRIAVDVMGGDYAPGAAVRSACEFASHHPDVELQLVGNEVEVTAVLPARRPPNVHVVHAEQVITADEEPVRAVRRKAASSLVAAARMVQDNSCDAMLSGGNTGALVAAGLLVIGRMESILRPALAPVLPTFDGRGVLLLDAGATVDCSPEHLLQFAAMGAIYSRHVLGVTEPRVALLNIGSEASKGNALTKEAYATLAATNLHFVGNVEARDLLNGHCDVVVCDGFVGNVVLKTVEGVGLGLLDALRVVVGQSVVSKVAGAVLRPSLRNLKQRFDYAEYGGAPLLGVMGGCLKAHGSSRERAWYTALEQSVKFVHNDLGNKLQVALCDAVAPAKPGGGV